MTTSTAILLAEALSAFVAVIGMFVAIRSKKKEEELS